MTSALTFVPLWQMLLKLGMLMAPLLVCGGLALACSEQSPNIGKYYKGRILHISVADLERTDELRWTTEARNTRSPDAGTFYRIVPEKDDNELVLLRVKVENHTATNAIVSIDQDAAQLRDFLQGRFRPVDVETRAVPAGLPESPSEGCNVPLNPEEPTVCVKFLWNTSYEETDAAGQTTITRRAQELPKGTGLDGWLVFEAPKDTQFRSFRWSSADTVTIDF